MLILPSFNRKNVWESISTSPVLRTKLRTADAFFTLPDNKHRDSVLTLPDFWRAKPSRVAGHRIPRTEENTQPVDAQRTESFPNCAGSLIGLSIDRRDIHYEGKELVRHMHDPQEVDWTNLPILARYLLHKPDLARVSTLNFESQSSGVLTTSSGEAETRALSRGERDILFIKQLAKKDFNLKLSMPRLWTNASTAPQTAERFGAGSRMRHIQVAALFVQELVHQNALKVGKVPGHSNPANCLTKHLNAALKERCLQELSMADMSMSDLRQMLGDAAQIQLVASLMAKHNASNTNVTPWKPNFTIALNGASASHALACSSDSGGEGEPGCRALVDKLETTPWYACALVCWLAVASCRTRIQVVREAIGQGARCATAMACQYHRARSLSRSSPTARLRPTVPPQAAVQRNRRNGSPLRKRLNRMGSHL